MSLLVSTTSSTYTNKTVIAEPEDFFIQITVKKSIINVQLSWMNQLLVV